LGNVRVVISDEKLLATEGTNTYLSANVLSYNDYYPFGMQMPGRGTPVDATTDYRYSFNGMEKLDEITNTTGGHLDFGARIYDARLGRWLACDPLAKEYTPISPYAFGLNNPIIFVDADGKVIVDANGNEVIITVKDGVLTFEGGILPDATLNMLQEMYKTETGQKWLNKAIHSKRLYNPVCSKDLVLLSYEIALDNNQTEEQDGAEGKYFKVYGITPPPEAAKEVVNDDGETVYVEQIIIFEGTIKYDVAENKDEYLTKMANDGKTKYWNGVKQYSDSENAKTLEGGKILPTYGAEPFTNTGEGLNSTAVHEFVHAVGGALGEKRPLKEENKSRKEYNESQPE